MILIIETNHVVIAAVMVDAEPTICRMCGEQIEEESPLNPNICRGCHDQTVKSLALKTLAPCPVGQFVGQFQ